LNDTAVLLELRNHFLPLLRSADGTLLINTTSSSVYSTWLNQEGFNHHEKHHGSFVIPCVSDFDRTPCKQLGQTVLQ
jgi:hypothetical protein